MSPNRAFGRTVVYMQFIFPKDLYITVQKISLTAEEHEGNS